MTDQIHLDQLDRIEDKIGQVLAKLDGAGPGPVGPPDQPGDRGQPVPTAERSVDILPALATWTITFPTGQQGSPTNLYPPKIGDGKGFVPGLFEVAVDHAGKGVLFTAPVDGVTTKNSKRTRTEARQMADDDWTKAAFDGSKPHKLTARLWGSTEDLAVRKSLSLAQIHDGGDDVCQVRIHRTEGYTGLCLFSDDGDTIQEIDPDYRDRQPFDLSIETGVGGREIVVSYSSGTASKVLRLAKTGTGWYWKIGAYNQSSIGEHHELPTSAGRVMVYQLAAAGNPLG